jgi:hypothetical protein
MLALIGIISNSFGRADWGCRACGVASISTPPAAEACASAGVERLQSAWWTLISEAWRKPERTHANWSSLHAPSRDITGTDHPYKRGQVEEAGH